MKRHQLAHLESVQNDQREDQTERRQRPLARPGEQPVGRRADEHPVDFQSQVTARGPGPGPRVQRRRRVVNDRDRRARDGRHHPHLPLEAHQHGHHWWDDAGFGRQQAHLIAGYLPKTAIVV